MCRKLISERSGEIPCSDKMPFCLKNFRATGGSFFAYSWAFGDSLIQEIAGDPRIRLHHTIFKDVDRLHLQEDQPLPALQFILSNSYYHVFEGLGKRVDHEGTCNFVYRPSGHQVLSGMNPRLYSKLELVFSREKLQPLAPHFPLLQQWMDRSGRDQPCLLDPANLQASEAVVGSLYELLYNTYQNELRKMYVQAKSMEILIEVLEAFARQDLTPPGKLMDPFEAERVYQVRDLLMQHKDNPHSISLAGLAQQAGTNTFRLNTGFKEIYGLTVFHFFLNIRMMRAQALLQNTKESIGHIARLAGYADPDSFSKAFKKYFGTSPRSFRSGHIDVRSRNGGRNGSRNGGRNGSRNGGR